MELSGVYVHRESVREHLVTGKDVLVDQHFGVCWSFLGWVSEK